METMIDIHGYANMFVGGRPTDPENYYLNYALVRGAAASGFVSDRRTRDPFKASRRRKLGHNSTVTSVFFNRYAPESGYPRLRITLYDVESLLNKSASGQTPNVFRPSAGSSSSAQSIDEGDINAEDSTALVLQTHEQPTTGSKTHAERSKRSHSLTPFELLNALS
jgi:hypothetical protein